MGGPIKELLTPPSSAVAKDAHWSARMQRIRDRKPSERDVRVWLDDDAKAEFERTQKGLIAARALIEQYADKDDSEELKTEARSRLADAESAFEQAKADREDKSELLWFRGLGRPAYEDLISQHPPTDEQKAQGQVYDDETFAPALISAVHVDKVLNGYDEHNDAVYVETGEKMSVEEAVELLTILSQTEAMTAFGTALAVCVTNRVEVGKGSGPTRN